jgi:hypothetical protein
MLSASNDQKIFILVKIINQPVGVVYPSLHALRYFKGSGLPMPSDTPFFSISFISSFTRFSVFYPLFAMTNNRPTPYRTVF